MPNITLLDIDTLQKTRLKPYIERCLRNRAPDLGFHAVIGHDICQPRRTRCSEGLQPR